ncbi:hypothetical protein [Flavobacterium nackdongense]|jgi:hypothetical protein|uniref:Uncharacterized protein n=1 Tax=Flavobacterium nackdongense TaxID=2547394 RepID=A0A4P6YA71_9FLAO|nr:hypothetical protein [Flavobacterium nackdongense]QBN20001.1 hypothetical protein E1750_14725 [Flavobacterium nackdongense]
MDTSYRFTSDFEPTEKQLEDLMTEVIKDVKKRAVKADLKFKEIQKKYFADVQKHQLAKLKQ